MGKLLKLMADYECFPLWEALDNGVRNVNLDELPLSSELRSELRQWSASYDRTLNQEYPPDSGFASPGEEAAFEAEGSRLWKELQAQLAPGYKVNYYSNQQGRLMESPPTEPNLALQLTGPATRLSEEERPSGQTGSWSRRSEEAIMPLFDHFHPPLHPHHHWESFHSNWATRIADVIAAVLPAEFQVEEHTHAGPEFEIDIATYERETPPEELASPGLALATQTAPAYAPPMPDATMPAAFPDTFAVRVFSTAAGLTLVAVVELVSPGNKDGPTERRAFATKFASYLAQGVSLIVVDVVTSRHANLHNEVMRLMEAAPELDFPDDVPLYASAYRPVRRGEQDEIDLWLRRLAVGAPLPTLPLRLTGDLFVEVDLEVAYQEACRRRRLA